MAGEPIKIANSGTPPSGGGGGPSAEQIGAIVQGIAGLATVIATIRQTSINASTEAERNQATLHLQQLQLEQTARQQELAAAQAARASAGLPPVTITAHGGVGTAVPGTVSIFGTAVPTWAVAVGGVALVDGVAFGIYALTKKPGIKVKHHPASAHARSRRRTQRR